MSDINWNDRLEVIREIKERDIFVLYDAPEHIKKDKYLISLGVASDYSCFECAHDELKCDKEFIKELIVLHKYAYMMMCHVDDKLLDDKEFIKELILLDNEVLNYNLENRHVIRFLNDKDFILFAIKINIEVFNYIPDELKNNKKFMLEILKVNFDVVKNIAIYHFGDDLSKWYYYKYRY